MNSVSSKSGAKEKDTSEPLVSKARGWRRFRLRSLLIAITGMAIWLGWTANVARQRERAVDAINEAGGTIVFNSGTEKQLSLVRRVWRNLWGDAYAKEVFSINLREKPVSEDIVRQAAVFSEMTGELILTRTKVRDDDLRHLAQHHHLQYLMLTETSIGDAGIKHISRLSNLQHLNLGGTNITDASAAELTKLPRIRQLMLTCPGVTDAMVEGLAPLSDLTTLYLNGSQVTDRGLARLHPFGELDELGLYMTDIGDAGVAHLVDLPNLRHINLSSTRITDAAMGYLAQLPKLEHLEISNTVVSDEAIAEFLSINPSCKVERYGRRKP